jgi:Tol biopolymer transport system component
MKFRIIVLVAVGIVVAATATLASAMSFSVWGPGQSLETAGGGAADSLNTAALEGCPSISRDGLTLYFASNRSGGYGGLDIYTSTRASTSAPWGEPVNLGSTINTAGNEFCPTPSRDEHSLMFVSNGQPGRCGAGADIFRAERSATTGEWSTPVDLGCVVNSPADEASPFLCGDQLYFSSTRSGHSQIYVASVADDGAVLDPPALAPGLSSTYNDARPNLRRDCREIIFDSDRPGGVGGIDLWTSTRSGANGTWSPPVDLTTVNSPANDLRASLSWDGTQLIFGSNRAGTEGNLDLYIANRDKVPASG